MCQYRKIENYNRDHDFYTYDVFCLLNHEINYLGNYVDCKEDVVKKCENCEYNKIENEVMEV